MTSVASMAAQQLAAAAAAAAPVDEIVGEVVALRKNGEDGGRFPLGRGTATIGRHEMNDIRIKVPFVSRKHAEIRVEDDGKVRTEGIGGKGARVSEDE